MGQTVADRWIGVDDDVLAVLLLLRVVLIVAGYCLAGSRHLGALSNVGKLI